VVYTLHPVLAVLADGAQPPAPAGTATTTQPTGHDQTGAQSGCGSQGGLGGMMFPMVMIFVVFYFMLIRPQQKKQRETQDWLKNLKKDDEVVTTGGVLGRITGLTDSTVTLEVQEKVRMKVLRSAVSGPAPSSKPTPSSSDQKSK
jgi:preprotein translocase subunit YajC